MRTAFSIIHSKLRSACLLGVIVVSQASAGFSSIHVFGDGVCTTTQTNPPPSPAGLYHENRYCNGKVFIEVLSQWQGVTYNAAKNNSFFGHNSSTLKNTANALVVDPAEAATALFIVWSANADFVEFVNELPGTPWTARINQSIADHTTAVTTLYNKGARVIVMPNAVDITAVPNYAYYSPAERTTVRNKVVEFNALFETAMANLMASKAGLKIYRVDAFTFFEQVQANPVAYGLINPPPGENYENAAIFAPINHALNGPGSNYVFWDLFHPTAKFQMHLAAFIQQIITPVKVNSISLSGGNVQIQVANVPLGRAGSIQGSANLQPPWVQDAPINLPFLSGGSTTTTLSFAASGAKRFYRAAFPVVWTWP